MTKEEQLQIALGTFKQLCEIHLTLSCVTSLESNKQTIDRVYAEILRLIEEC